MANQPSKYSKFLVGAASAALVASAVAPVASAADFKDTKGNTHETAIDALSDAGVISGYPDGTFLPNKTLTRSDVVKMLGKWLVNTQGVEIPTDYKTKPRFADQTAKTNDELLKYSAVVKDNGVFNGLENGTLDATADITRENMALVLVRAFDAVHKTDLVAYVAEKEFNKDVTDRATAKAEARPYIDVLDFFDITNPAAPKFNPKATTTRGQFASFLHKTTSVEVSDINAEVDSIVATNNTTVEVTFKTEIEDIKALDFAIEGLTVSNASVKQTGGNKVVVLTTSAQVGDKSYTVTANGTKLGTFKGVSAVVPTSIKVTTPSLQGVIGKEVTLSAQVTVAEGQSKAGIPVTFNIVSDNPNSNSKIEVEAFTNADGVASYSYTRYYSHNDSVAAYATSKSTVVSSGKVYWASAAQLTVKDITEATSLVNGSKKVYEINSKNNANGYVFVAFEENLNVAPNVAVTGAKVEGVSTYTLDSAGKITNTLSLAAHPYEYTTGGKAVTAVKLDKDGKANLVVTGSNASVTPIVYTNGFVDATKTLVGVDASYGSTLMQAKASTVKFELKHELGLTIKAEGVQNAATYKTATETGGRDYTITYTDKDGKVAAPGTRVLVAVDTKGVNGVLHVLDADNKEVAFTTSTATPGVRYYSVEVKKEGKASFTVSSTNVNDYVAPVAFIDNGKTTLAGSLDADDLQAQSEVTYFVADVTYTSKLSAVDAAGKPVTAVIANGVEYADFVYELVDQNGKPRSSADATTVSFEVKAGTGIVVVNGTDTLQPGATKTVNAVIAAGSTKANVRVVAQNPSTVSVSATGSRAGVVLPSTNPASVTVNFSQYGTAEVTGVAKAVNTTLDVLSINNVVYNYANSVYKYNGSVIDKAAFEGYIATNAANVSVTKDTDGKFTFNVITTADTGSVVAQLNNASTAAAKETIVKANYPELSAAQATAFAAALQTQADSQAITATSLQNAYNTLFVSVKSAVALDLDGNGSVDAIDVTFNEALHGTHGLVAGDFTLTNGTVATFTDTTPGDDVIRINVTGATGSNVGTLKVNPTAKTAGTLANGAASEYLVGGNITLTAVTTVTGFTAANHSLANGLAGVAEAKELTIGLTSVGSSTAKVQIQATGFNAGVAKDVSFATTNLDTEPQVLAKAVAALEADTAVSSFFTVSIDGAKLVLTKKTVGTADANFKFLITDNATATAAAPVAGNVPALATKGVYSVTTTPIVNAGNVVVTIKRGTVDHTVNVAVAAGDTAAQVASKVALKLSNDTVVTGLYDVTPGATTVIFTEKEAGVIGAAAGNVTQSTISIK